MKNNKGITIIALVITVIVLAILAGILVVSSIQTVDYTKENKFIAELKVIREKVNIASKEISLGSTVYNDVGKDINTLSTDMRTNILNIFTKCGISAEQQANYKYFDTTELEKLGIYNIEHNVLIDLNNVDIISVDGITINGIIYYTAEKLQTII